MKIHFDEGISKTAGQALLGPWVSLPVLDRPEAFLVLDPSCHFLQLIFLESQGSQFLFLHSVPPKHSCNITYYSIWKSSDLMWIAS